MRSVSAKNGSERSKPEIPGLFKIRDEGASSSFSIRRAKACSVHEGVSACVLELLYTSPLPVIYVSGELTSICPHLGAIRGTLFNRNSDATGSSEPAARWRHIAVSRNAVENLASDSGGAGRTHLDRSGMRSTKHKLNDRIRQLLPIEKKRSRTIKMPAPTPAFRRERSSSLDADGLRVDPKLLIRKARAVLITHKGAYRKVITEISGVRRLRDRITD